MVGYHNSLAKPQWLDLPFIGNSSDYILNEAYQPIIDGNPCGAQIKTNVLVSLYHK